MIKVGIFWTLPDGKGGQRVLEFHKSFNESEANSLGFINYPYSHYEVWDEEVRNLGDDCYKYPRGRVLYDCNRNKHRIYADECISQSAIDEIVKLFEIKKYELCRGRALRLPLLRKEIRR